MVWLNEEHTVETIVIWVETIVIWIRLVEPRQSASILPDGHLIEDAVMYEIVATVLGRNFDSKVVYIHCQILDEYLTWFSDQTIFQILISHILTSYDI